MPLLTELIACRYGNYKDLAPTEPGHRLIPTVQQLVRGYLVFRSRPFVVSYSRAFAVLFFAFFCVLCALLRLFSFPYSERQDWNSEKPAQAPG